jgi:hypothetical protein
MDIGLSARLYLLIVYVLIWRNLGLELTRGQATRARMHILCLLHTLTEQNTGQSRAIVVSKTGTSLQTARNLTNSVYLLFVDDQLCGPISDIGGARQQVNPPRLEYVCIKCV